MTMTTSMKPPPKIAKTGLSSRAAGGATAAKVSSLASLGLKLVRGAVVDASTGAPYELDVCAGAPEMRNERGYVAWEGVAQAAQQVVLDTLMAPLPPPDLDLEEGATEPHWSKQTNEGGRRRGYGLVKKKITEKPPDESSGMRRAKGAALNGSTILVSPQYAEAEKLFVLVPNGSGGLAIWNKEAVVNGPIEDGTVLRALDLLLSRFVSDTGFASDVTEWQVGAGSVGVIILNPGETCWVRSGRSVTLAAAALEAKWGPVAGCENVEQHVKVCMEEVVIPTRAKKVFILGAERGAASVIECLQENFRRVAKRVQAIALMHSQHTSTSFTDIGGFFEWFRERSINYTASWLVPDIAKIEDAASVGSDEEPDGQFLALTEGRPVDPPLPLGTPALDATKGCICCSAGTDKIQRVPELVMALIFELFDDIDNAPSPVAHTGPSLIVWDKMMREALDKESETRTKTSLMGWDEVQQSLDELQKTSTA